MDSVTAIPPAAAGRRIRRELATIRVMIGLFCRDRHGCGRALCADCAALWDYARLQVERCRFGAGKPTCARCPVHCFKPSMRRRVRAVMRFAGPRMAWRHPLLALFHLLDGRRGLRTGRRTSSPCP